MSQARAADWAVDDWPLERVVGQLFCTSVGHHTDGAYGFSDTIDDVCEQVARLHLGGVCWFPDGEQGARPEVVAEQVTRLQAAAPTPLLVTIDQEGGLVTRMRGEATRWPSAMARAAAFGGPHDDWDEVRTIARALGDELRAVGAGQAYAPVADVNIEPGNPVIGIRSASSDPAQVSHFVEATVRGLADAGIGSCLKHFPGHGNTRVDSHLALPSISVGLDEWRSGEAVPFVAGISAGVDAVMIGHLRAPGLDPSDVPATFSRAIVTGLLREELGFEGVIVTDAMDMAGAQLDDDEHGRPGPAVACLRALQAGVDQLLMPRDAAGAIEVVLQAVRDGELDEAQLRASAGRIMALKKKLGLLDESPAARPAPDLAAHGRLARRAISRALTWRDQSARCRLEPGRPVVVLHDAEPPSAGRGIEDVPSAIAEGLRARGWRVTQHQLGTGEPDTDEFVILVTRDAWRYPEVAEQVRRTRADLLVAARSPHDQALVPAEVPALFSYGDIAGVGEAVVDALVAGVALGALPIDLPHADDPARVRWPRSGADGSQAPARVTIRPYRDDDWAALGRICLRTGASGADATGQFADDDLLPWVYAWPYVAFEPSSCLVVDVAGEAVGYVLGVSDVRTFAEWWAREWTPRFTQRFDVDADWGPGERNLLRRGLQPELMVAPWHDDAPAELHIDLLPVVQGMGLGRELVDAFRAVMAERGVERLCLGVGARNTNAIAFYRRLGFELVREHRNEQGELVALTMAIPTGGPR